MHRKEGFGLNYYDRERKYFYELPQKKMLKDIKRSEMLSEEMRILYVALTRAREKLFILGSERNVNSKIKKLSSLISTEDFKISGECASGARSYMDWILMSVLRDKTCSLYDRTQAYRHTYRSSVFSISLLHKNDVVLDLADNTERRDFLALCAKDGFDISEILDFKYIYTGLSQLPANLSVTELRRRENEDNVFELYKSTKMKNPKFFEEQSTVTLAQIGTLTHLVMEKLDFASADSPENIKKQISDMVLGNILTEDEAKYINTDNIFRILNTNVGRKMIKNADKIRREYSFMYLIDACELSPDADTDEKIVVQGTIDAFFEDEDGHLVVVDYKTDKIRSSLEDIMAKYKPQIRYYCRALEKTFGKKVSNAYLMLLDSGDVIEC
jgi:ATP-dependent helicase/nuclease subunit A